MTYSFKDVKSTLTTSMGLTIPLAGLGSGSSEEGITIEAPEDKSTLTMGADGSGMHNLVAAEASTVTMRFLKAAAVNALLNAEYQIQTQSARLHGKNTIVVADTSRGDMITLFNCAFKKRPSLTYAKEGGIMEWAFDAIRTVTVLGVGQPEVP